LRRRFDAVGQVAVVDFVEIHLQDFILAVFLVHDPGQDDLFGFAVVGNGRALVIIEGDVADDLLGDGAAADGALGRIAVVGDDGRHQRRDVQAGVLVEAVILHGDGGRDHGRGNLGQSDFRPFAFAEKFPEQFAVAVENARGLEGFALAGGIQLGDASLDFAGEVAVDQRPGDDDAAEYQHRQQQHRNDDRLA
jgi:hypothetical protein